MNKTLLIISGLTLGIVTVLTLNSKVLAYRGDASVQGPNYSAERHEQMTSALDSNDYQAWYELMQNRGRIAQVVTPENFEKFVEMHRLRTEGDLEGANVIRAELGLGQALRDGSGRENRMGYGRNADR